MRDPSGAGLFGPGQHAVPRAQRRAARGALAAGFDQPQPWRRGGIVGLPGRGNGDRFAILDLDHAQHGDPWHPAQAVECRAVAIDQPFIRHVAQQGLELDLLLPLQPEGARDFPFAGGLFRLGDEIEHLLARRQALRERRLAKGGLAKGGLGHVAVVLGPKAAQRQSALRATGAGLGTGTGTGIRGRAA